MFNYRGDMNPKHNIPGMPAIDFTTGIFAFIGFGYMLARLTNPAYFIYVAVFFVFIVSGFFTIEAPQSLRVIFTITAVTAFAAVFAGRLLGIIHKSPLNKAVKIMFKSAAACVIILAGVNNFYLYFEKQAKNPKCWQDFATDAYTAGTFYKNLGPGWNAKLAIEEYKIRTFNMAVSGENIDNFARFSVDDIMAPGYRGTGNYVYILTPYYSSMVDSVFRVMYPEGKYTVLNNKYDENQMLYFAYEVTAKDAEKAEVMAGKNGVTLARYLL
jgi:hypothetical protein